MSSKQKLRAELKRHFTATGFVIYSDSVLLHWHKKVLEWLPPGGHIELNEDPVEAVLREVKEETGLDVEIRGDLPLIPRPSYPKEILAPRHIFIENIDDPVDGFHQHIDMIYYCIPIGSKKADNNWMWVARNELLTHKKLHFGGILKPPPSDVRELALHAMDIIGQ